MIRFKCTNCSRVLKASPQQAGRKTKCTACGTALTIPTDAGEAEGALVGAGAAVAIGQTEIGTSSDMLSVVKLRRAGAGGPLLAPPPQQQPDLTPDEQGRVKVVCKQCGKKFRTKQPDQDAKINCNQCDAEVPIPGRQPTAEKPTAEKPAAEKPAAEKPAAEKPAAEKPAAEKSPDSSAADKIDRPSRSEKTDKSDKPAKPAKPPARPMGEDSIMMVLGTGNMPKAAPGTLAVDSLGAAKTDGKTDGKADGKADAPVEEKSSGARGEAAVSEESAGLESLDSIPVLGSLLVGSTTIGGHTVDAQGRVRFACENCGKKFRAPMGDRPKKLKCTGCAKSLTVPGRKTSRVAVAEEIELDSTRATGTAAVKAKPSTNSGKSLVASASATASASSDVIVADSGEEDFAAKARAMMSTAKKGPAADEAPAAAAKPSAALNAPVAAEPVEEEEQMTSSSGLFEVSDLMAQLDAVRRKTGATRAGSRANPATQEIDKPSKSGPKPAGGARVELADDAVRERKPDADKSRGKTAALTQSVELRDKTAAEKPSEKPSDKASDKAPDKAGDKPSEKAADKAGGKAIAPPSDAMKAALKALETGSGSGGAGVGGSGGDKAERAERATRTGGGRGLIEDDGTYPTWAFVLGAATILAVGFFGWQSFFAGDGSGPVDRVSLNARAVSAEEDDSTGLLREFPLTMGNAVYAVAFSPDGKNLAACGQDRFVYVWSIADGKEVLKFDAGLEQTAMAFSPDGQHLITGGKDGVLRVWNPTDGKPIFHLPCHLGQVTAMLVTEDGKSLVTAGRDTKIHIWDRSAAPYARLGVLEGHTSPVNALAATADGRKLYSGAGPGGNDQTLRVWDIAERREITRPEDSYRMIVLAVALSPDGKQAVTAGSEKQIRFVDSSTGQTTTVPGHKDFVVALAISPDGKKLASAAGRQDKDVLLWNLAERKERQRLMAPGGTGPAEGVRCLAFSPRSKRLAVGGLNGTVRLYGVGD